MRCITSSCLIFFRSLPIWPAILRPGKTLAGVAEEPMDPRCLLDLDPWVMGPLLMFHLLMVPAIEAHTLKPANNYFNWQQPFDPTVTL